MDIVKSKDMNSNDFTILIDSAQTLLILICIWTLTTYTAHYVYFTMYCSSLVAVMYLNTDYVYFTMDSSSLVAESCIWTCDYAAHYVYFTMYCSSLVAVMYLNTDYAAHYVYFTMYIR